MLSGKQHTSESIERMRVAKSGVRNPNYGKPRSTETKLKTSASLKGHPISEQTRKRISDSIRKRIPEYTHKLIDAWDDERRAKQARENNPNWKGGVSFEPYCPKFSKRFKERVRLFFGNICVECGTKQNGIKLSVHHVNFNKKSCCDNSVPLFVPLCHDCHAKTNYKRDYWEKHFTQLINDYYGGKCYLTEQEFAEISNVT